MPPPATTNNRLRNIKLAAAGVVLLIIGGMVLNYFLTHAQLVIDAKGMGNEAMNVRVIDSNNKEVKSVGISQNKQATVWLPTGEYSLSLEQGHRNTLAAGKVQAFKKNTVSMETKDEVASARLAGESRGCGVFIGDTYYNYECFQPTQIYRYTNQENVPVSAEQYSSVTPVANGVVAVHAEAHGDVVDLLFIDPVTARETILTLPDKVYEAGLDDVMIVPNHDNSAEYQFALVLRSSNDWLLYKNADDPNPRSVLVGRPQDSSLNIAAAQLLGDRLVSYFTFTDFENHSESQEPQPNQNENTPPSQLRIHSINQNKLEAQYAFPKNLAQHNVQLAGNNLVLAETQDGLALLTPSQDSLELKGFIRDAQNVTVNNNRIFFSRAGSVYQLSETTLNAHRLFSASNFSVASLGVSGSNVIMQAYTGAASQHIQGTPSVYTLDLTKVASYPRPEWDIPVGQGSQLQNAVPGADSHEEQVETKFSGIDKLLELGLSAYQADNLRYSLVQYANKADMDLHRADIDTGSINQKYRDWRAGETKTEVSFKLTLNSTEKLNAQMLYWDIKFIRLYLTNSSGAQVYDSGEVNIHQ